MNKSQATGRGPIKAVLDEISRSMGTLAHHLQAYANLLRRLSPDTSAGQH